jgi:hypothetical protein
LNGLVNGILNGSAGGAGEFDELVDLVFHVRFFWYGRRMVSLGILTNDWWVTSVYW